MLSRCQTHVGGRKTGHKSCWQSVHRWLSRCACRVRPAKLQTVPGAKNLGVLLKQQAECVCTMKQPAQQAAAAKGFERLLMASISAPGATGEAPESCG